VLDNARDEQQIRPLLRQPGQPGANHQPQPARGARRRRRPATQPRRPHPRRSRPAAHHPPRHWPRRRRAGRGRRDRPLVRVAAAGAGGRRGQRRRPARLPTGGPCRRTARHGRAAGCPGCRRPGGQRPRSILLVLRSAQPRHGAHVPAAGPTPRPRHIYPSRRQPCQNKRTASPPAVGRASPRAPDRRARPGPVYLP
jgi:hypothetical protein